ncbi:trans-sialidase [Trypanosoma cruzi]|nr:trans-sialidase [Trypanosoma cruzi]
MIALCGGGQSVFESRDMGQRGRRLSEHSQACGSNQDQEFVGMKVCMWDLSSPRILREGRSCCKLRECTPRGKKRPMHSTFVSRTTTAPFMLDRFLWRMLWVRRLPTPCCTRIVCCTFHERGAVGTRRDISLARLTEELKTIKSTLSTWAQLDASFSKSSTPMTGLVGFLSNTSSGGNTWIDEYRCVDASVTKAAKVKNGFKFAGPGSMATWPVNSREDSRQYSFVNHRFTLVATVTIHQVAKGSTPLLGAGLGDGHGAKIIGLSYGMNKTWETVFDGKKTTSNTTWELGKEHQVALMLQDGNKGSVYVDGVIVGNPAKIPKVGALGHEITHFYFGGGEGDSDSSVTVTNVFLYNRH